MTNKEAIVWLKECKEHYGEYHEMCDEALDIAIKALEERPQGEWIFGSTLGHGWMKCSNCCVSQSGQTLCWSFCPNCGADMRGKNELKEAENE